jgi:hypothetical protein
LFNVNHEKLFEEVNPFDALEDNSREAHSLSPKPLDGQPEKRLGAWKERFSSENINTILEVVTRVGIVGFDENIMPSANVSVDTRATMCLGT